MPPAGRCVASSRVARFNKAALRCLIRPEKRGRRLLRRPVRAVQTANPLGLRDFLQILGRAQLGRWQRHNIVDALQAFPEWR